MLIKESIFIAQKAEVIWDYWIDVSNDIHWRNGITKARWTSEPPYGIGSTGEHTQEKMGILSWEVSAYKEGESFEFIHTKGGLKGSVGFFKVDAEKDGSQVQVRMKISGPFIMRLMLLFMGKMMHNSVKQDIIKLKSLLEEQN